VATARAFTQATRQQSGTHLELPANGSGSRQVSMPAGTTGYTRDGSLQVDSQGRLVTSSGLAIAGDITVPAEAQSVTVGKDGVVPVKMPGNAQPQQVGNLELASFVNPAGLEPLGGNLYAES